MVASWAEFEQAEPEFASRALELLTTRKHLTMATLRRDGSPRISGTEVQFADGELRIGSMPGSVKSRDLRRDARLALHGPTQDPGAGGAWPGEAKVAGRARPLALAGGADFFAIDLHEVVVTRLDAERTRLVIESWKPGRGYRRRTR